MFGKHCDSNESDQPCLRFLFPSHPQQDGKDKNIQENQKLAVTLKALATVH